MAEKQYSEKEILEFRERDLRIVRQNALAHGSLIATATGASDATPDILADVTLALADRFVDFVYGGMQAPKAKDSTPPVGATTTSNVQPGAPGVPTSVRVTTTKVENVPASLGIPVPTKENMKVIQELASKFASEEPGMVVDTEEFAKRIYVAFNLYPTKLEKAYPLIRDKVTIPFIGGDNA
jgi:hypothetical protein